MGEPKGGRYGALIKQAKQASPETQSSRKPENQISGQSDGQISRQPAPEEKQVNLCVKVPESLRRHWGIQAKIQGVTMTAVMVEALTERFGKPDNQISDQGGG